MELQRLIDLIRFNLGRIILFTILIGIATGIGAAMLPKTYTATSTLVVGQALVTDPPVLDEIVASAAVAQAFADLATTRPILLAALAEANDTTPVAAFRERVDARADQGSVFVIINVRADDPQRSAALTNAVAHQLIVQGPTLLAPGKTSAQVPLTPIEAAIAPDSPTSPRVLLYALLGAAAAALAAVVVVVIAASRKGYRRVATEPAETSADPVVTRAPSTRTVNPRA